MLHKSISPLELVQNLKLTPRYLLPLCEIIVVPKHRDTTLPYSKKYHLFGTVTHYVNNAGCFKGHLLWFGLIAFLLWIWSYSFIWGIHSAKHIWSNCIPWLSLLSGSSSNTFCRSDDLCPEPNLSTLTFWTPLPQGMILSLSFYHKLLLDGMNLEHLLYYNIFTVQTSFNCLLYHSIQKLRLATVLKLAIFPQINLYFRLLFKLC